MALFKKGFLSISIAGLLLSTTVASAQDDDSGFRSRVRQAFEQDVPHINDADVAEEFERRSREARDPNLDTDIPEVSGREIGPRISVKEFRFHRLEEYPEFGIDRETVEAKAEALRVKYMQEDKMVAAGYTVDNLKEIALLLDGMGARFAPESLGPRELRKLINVLERQNNQRGLSYVDLEDIAAELTRFYRQQGLFLAQVQIPAQEVKDGIVTFSVQEGILGQVSVHDNQKYSEKQLAAAFSSQKGKLVNHDSIEESLYLLNDLPALNVTGYFSPGDNPGETRLNLKVRDESDWRLVTRMDNHGSTFTGDNRIFTAVDWFNPLGIGDELTVGYLKSSGIDDFDSGFGSNLGQLKYSLPLFSPRTRLLVSADYNKFKIHDADDDENFINLLELEGVNENYGVTVEQKFKRSRDFNITGSFGLTDKKSDITSITPVLDSWDHALGGEIGAYMDRLSGGAIPMLNVVNAKFQYGELTSYSGESELETDSDFQKFAAETSSLLFLPMPFTTAQSRLILKSRWQYSENALPSFEQLTLGGANGVRAFDVRDFSADQAGLFSAEWYPSFPDTINPRIFGSRLNDILQVAVIADAGYGVVNNFEPGLDNDWAALAGAGFLFKFSWSENWASQLSLAWPTTSKSSIDGTGDNADEPTIYADFSYFLQ
ncbi:ShlB/FhaC/HecB family hemolysin secretion/activation protein [Microbulbifer sp. ALW1]|uniref:ShlB/FhaC/HecB family hemolysin secretion/activation protein n=1 Tax=Microbulbifer sp. (strain ALW1) TaxID=1516059 RepID=UPI0013591604|nr:ShlB/FhaC/HecB family hemolysin secretion/activation protein [Microbulbifer sp. ALW1]